MQLFCPSCHAAFAGASHCPRCGGLLLMPQEAAAFAMAERPADDLPEGFVTPTPTNRVVVGTVLALGLYLGLRKLVAAAVLVHFPDPSVWWQSLDGLIGVFAVQATAALFGAMLAGAGRTNGFLLGAAVGGLCGGLFVVAEILAGAPTRELVLYLQPPILSLAGGVAGAVGCRVWAAIPVLDIRPPIANKLSSVRLAVETVRDDERPTAWIRVVVGATIMVAGVGLADAARHKAQKYSGGLLRVESTVQGQFLSWQLATFAILLGGVTAGAGTGAGLRHGLLAGFLGGAGAVGLTASQGQITPAMEYWLSKLSLAGAAPNDPATLAGIATGIVLAALAGGWLGAQVFLPIAPDHMQSRRLRMGD